MLTPATLQEFVHVHGPHLYHIGLNQATEAVQEHGLLPGNHLPETVCEFAGEWRARPDHVYFHTEQNLLAHLQTVNEGKVIYGVDAFAIGGQRITADEDAFWALATPFGRIQTLKAADYDLTCPLSSVRSMYDPESAYTYESYGQWAHEEGLGDKDPLLVLDAAAATSTVAMKGIISPDLISIVSREALDELRPLSVMS